MNPDTAKQILDEVYNHGDRMQIFSALEPIDKGSYVSLICPSCGKRRAYAYQPTSGKNPHIIRCNRSDNCGYKATLVEYAAGESKPRGESFLKAVKWLADVTGITILDNVIQPTTPPLKQFKKPKNKKLVPLESKQVSRYKNLSLEKTALEYLSKRGISEETAIEYGIKFAGWGRWPHFIIDNVTQKPKLHTNRQWYPGRLVIPIYDDKNNLISLYGRAIPGDRKPYKHLKHDYVCETKGIFNQKALEKESVHVTEGCFDALAIIEAAKKQSEVKHVSAVHGVYGLKWELVKSKNICFVFDPDKAGETWKEHADQGIALGKRIFYLKPESYKGYEDIAEVWEKERHIDFQYEEYK